MKIAFIGSGHVGQALAKLFIKAGHSVVLTNRHGKDSLLPVASKLGSAAQAADINSLGDDLDLFVLAIPFNGVNDLDGNLLKGKKVIDASNYFPQRDGRIPKLINHEISSSQMLADYFKGSTIVKAFNTIPVSELEDLANFENKSERIAIPIAGDDVKFKNIVAELIDQIGFNAYDAGNLKNSFTIQADGPIFGLTVDKKELSKKLHK
ncbi:putative F420-dependent NADP reductase [Oenococcus oeni]|uniref:NADPH-dependent F420 reductase n=1 Tax=Oenococcus oeni TaxID=1247 RepID=UPI0010B811B2|nr:NAD(P)-binding domain-containing protein [Oenococcus oeni]SYW12385.1 putative F420-dependent NADP reductase [Oenococcus oeni]